MVYIKVDSEFVSLDTLSQITNISSSDIERYVDNGVFTKSEYRRPQSGSRTDIVKLKLSSGLSRLGFDRGVLSTFLKDMGDVNDSNSIRSSLDSFKLPATVIRQILADVEEAVQ